ncbi:efflux RND transporter periplasmic adaptor subunit [Taklimakanibacter deserti]|uniref:efflux RND transporter periplasmic adaptor subunit n=1 Tax=Taklimakanibacter deserti TaxID=2267839 RepID=UPI0013C4BA22
MKRMTLLLGFFLAVAAGVLVYWQSGPLMRGAEAQDAARSRQVRDAAIPVVLGQARRMTLPVIFSTIGTIQPVASITVTSQVSGIVSDVAIADGADVRQGDILIALDARLIDTQIEQAQATIAKDKANIEKAQRDLGRIDRLLKNKFETPENAADAQTTLDLAQATLASDQASLRNLEVQREYYTIRAPVTGRIGTVPAKPGSTIVAGAQASPIATVNVFDPIYVAVGIPQGMIADLAEDKAQGRAKISLTVPGRSDKLEGAVTVIDNAASAATGLVTALATIANKPPVLWPGEVVNADVVFRDEADALAVPNEAIQTNQQGPYVYTVDGERRAHAKPVTVARSMKGMTVIAQGLNEGDSVVTDGQLLLTDGALVSVKQAMAGE